METLTLIIASTVSENLPGLCRGALKLMTSFIDRISANILSTLSMFKPSDCYELWNSLWLLACYNNFCAKMCKCLIAVRYHPCPCSGAGHFYLLCIWVNWEVNSGSHSKLFKCRCLFLMTGSNSFSLQIRITSSALQGGLAASGKTGLIPMCCIIPDWLPPLWEKDLSLGVNLSAIPMCTSSSVFGLIAAVKWLGSLYVNNFDNTHL